MTTGDPFGLTLNQNAWLVHSLINRLKYKEGWTFYIHGYAGTHRALQISVDTVDSQAKPAKETQTISYDHQWGLDVQLAKQPFRVIHLMPIPPYPMDEREAEHWILEMILSVEQHEACEFFRIDGIQTYFPEHGANSDPYKIERRD